MNCQKCKRYRASGVFTTQGKKQTTTWLLCARCGFTTANTTCLASISRPKTLQPRGGYKSWVDDVDPTLPHGPPQSARRLVSRIGEVAPVATTKLPRAYCPKCDGPCTPLTMSTGDVITLALCPTCLGKVTIITEIE